jgi:hypothetical protein
LDFVISRSEGIVSIDNQPLVINTSSVPANVAIVVYDCSSGAGSIEYNDRLRILEPFIDLTPYASFINAWLTAAAAITGMPVTLAQAKTVKLGLVDGIFNSKRQLPISYAGRTWDATDQSMLGMQAAIAAWDIAQSITNGDNQFSNNVNAISLQTPRTADVSASAISPTTDTIDSICLAPVDGQHDANWYWGSAGPGVTGVYGGDVTQQPNVSMSKSQINAPLQIVGPPIDWPPLNSTVTVSLAMSDMRTLIATIQQRRTTLQNTRLAKINAINAMGTIAAVIAYDVTTGWPF